MKKYLSINLSISAFLAFFFLVSMLITNPAYILQDDNFEQSDPGFINPDAYHYYLMGKNLLEYRIFSRDQWKPKEYPDFHRTPAYPIILACIMLLSSRLIFIFIFHILLYLLSIYFLMKLTFLLTKSAKASFIAGLLMALNISSYAYIFMTMAETTFIFLIIITFYYCILFIDTNKKNIPWKTVLYLGMMVGFWTAVNVLVRPATKMLLFVFIFILLFLQMQWKKKIALVFACLLIHGIIVIPWLYRNYRLFSLWQYSSAQSITTIFWTGGTAYSIKHNIDVYDAHHMIAREYNIPSYEETLNYWLYPRFNPTEIEKKYKEVLPNVLLKYPKELVLGAIGGILKAHISHNNDIFAELYGLTWHGGGLNKLFKLQFKKAWDSVFQNNGFLVFFFVYQNLYIIVLYGLTAFGFFWILRRLFDKTLQMAPAYWFLLISSLYFVMIIAMVSLYAYARFRMMLEIVYYLFSAHVLLFKNRFMK